MNLIPVDDRELYDRLAQTCGSEAQLNQAVEELCELAVAIRHYIRGRHGSGYAMLEEIADVSIMLDQVVCILGAEHEFPVVRAGSLARLRERLESGELA